MNFVKTIGTASHTDEKEHYFNMLQYNAI